MPDWRRATISSALAQAAATWPEDEALLAEGVSLTFSALDAEVTRMSGNLLRLGLQKGDRIAILMGNCAEWVTLFLAAGRMGAVVVPVNTRLKGEEVAYFLANSGARMLVAASGMLNIDFIAILRGVCPAIDGTLPDPALPALQTILILGPGRPSGALSFDALRDPAGDEAALPETGAEDPLLIQYTSGTTSRPKGAILTHASMLRDAFEAARRLGLRPGDRHLSARPLFHIAGTVMSLLTSLQSGACYITTLTFDAEKLLDLLEAERCTHTNGNDAMFLMLMGHPTFPGRQLRLRGGLVAATGAVMRQIHDRMGMHEICCGYGMSEASGNIAHSPFDDDLEKRLAAYSLPLPGVEIRIIDPQTGADLPAGRSGEILIRGWNLMQGYHEKPAETAEAIDPQGWLHSGDLGMMDDGGRLLFLGRLKETLRVGGENVAPAEIEDILHRHPAIRQAQVIGVPDERLSEVPAAYVVLKDDAAAEPDEIIAWTKARCANFKVPRYVRFVAGFDDIGMTASAKVQKSKLREYALGDLGLKELDRG